MGEKLIFVAVRVTDYNADEADYYSKFVAN